MILLRSLLASLLAFLVLGAVDGDGGGDGSDDGAAPESDDAGTGDDTLDELINLADGGSDDAGAGGEAADTGAAVKEARRRAEAAENLLAAERTARAAAEARAAPQQRYVDPDYEREEAEIAQAKAAGANADQLNWLQWKVDSNRRMRASQQASYGALARAEDLQDRMAFERLEVSKPQVFKKYAPRVEAAMNEMRARGQNAPRLAVLRLLIGDDIMNGALKPKSRAAASSSSTVDRGRNVSARGDVGTKGRLTEQQKRVQRLQNQII